MTAAITNRAHSVRPDQTQGQRLMLVPILGPSHDQPPYELLRQETLPSVKVTEISQQASVPELRVTNDLDVRVYLMDGQELVVAKQNRILNTDVLVPARSTISIPVSCVEQGRWHHVSPSFSSSGKSASHRTRSGKSPRVYESLKKDQRHDANQSTVWAEVAMSLHESGSSSPTMALSDAYAKREADLNEFRKSMRMPPEAVGLAVFHSGKFLGLDLFDRHSTLQYFWASLVDSYAIDYLATPVDPTSPGPEPEAQVIRSILDRAANGKWEAFQPPGEGKDWRLEDEQLAGSSLVWDDQVVVHLQLFPKQVSAGSSDDQGTLFRPRIQRRFGGSPPTAV